jgi:signal transduction histidine kinase
MTLPVSVSLAPGQSGRPAPDESAEAGFEWRIAQILILFRLLHMAQVATTLPSVGPSVRYPEVGLALLAVLAVESAWYTRRLMTLRQYGGGLTASVELTTAVLALLCAALILPQANRDVLSTPLLDLTTEQLTAATLSRVAPARLVAGGAAVIGAYLVLILTGDPQDLGHVDAIVGLGGFIVIPVLIWRGGQYIRLLAKNLDRARLELAATSRTLAQEEERRRFGTELHNYLLHTLNVFFGADLGDPAAARRVRDLFGLVAERLRSYMETGQFSEPAPFLDMLARQAAQAGREGLTVQLVVPDTVRLDPPELTPADGQRLESALRAVLINVRAKAGVGSTLLRVTTRDGLVRLTVTDYGRGFPADVLARGPRGWRSLGRHHADLQGIGGDLTITSRPGLTQVVLGAPVLTRAGAALAEPEATA